VEERCCPLDGCDSVGHLGGRAEKHFTIEACPKYHNKTAQECKVSGWALDSEHHQYEDLGLFQFTRIKTVPSSFSFVVQVMFYPLGYIDIAVSVSVYGFSFHVF
jgi:hypothetical protein